MLRTSGIAAAFLAFGLAGCTTVVVEDPRPVPIPAPLPGPRPVPEPVGSCFAEDAGWAVGRNATTGVVERATLDSGARTARIIGPGQAVTQDYNPDRLNIEVDETNRIIRLRCG
jgi:hypothetical protein